MDEQLTKLIKENKGILRQLTDLNNMVKGLTIIYKDMVIDNSYLEKRVRVLEQAPEENIIDVNKIKEVMNINET